MPIKAENRAKYSQEWPLISRLIRKHRAGDQCECRGECGIDHGAESDENWDSRWLLRCPATNRARHPITGSKVVLTVAHLDQDPTNNRESNLKALCQRCHFALDAKPSRAKAAKTRRARKAVRELL